jgi:hypothetical protein
MMNFDVFISYPHQDKATADAVCAKLEAEGIRCWIAPRDVAPGAEWASSIVEAIGNCRAMVLIFSSNANSSKQIRREVQQAFEKEVTVVPFRIENVAPEKSLAYYMGPVHWLDALTAPLEQHLQRLAAAVKPLVPPPPRSAEAEQAPVSARADVKAEAERDTSARDVERRRQEAEAAVTKDAEARQRVEAVARSRGEAEEAARAAAAAEWHRPEAVTERAPAAGPPEARGFLGRYVTDGRGRFTVGVALLMNASLWTAWFAMIITTESAKWTAYAMLIPAFAWLIISLGTMRGMRYMKWISIVWQFLLFGLAVLDEIAVGSDALVWRYYPAALRIAWFPSMSLIEASIALCIFLCWRGWHTTLQKPLLKHDSSLAEIVITLTLLVCPFWITALLLFLARAYPFSLAVCCWAYAASLALTFVCSKLWLAENRPAVRNAVVSAE